MELDYFEPSLFIFDAYLLLAKISKKFASMFVWRFVTCQNFEEICKYVRLTVCPFVCLFVCLSFDNSRTLWHIITKLDPHMYPWPVQKCIVFTGHSLYNIQCPPAKRSCLVQQASWRKKNRAWRVPLPLNNIIFYKSREGLEFWSKLSTVLWFMPRNMH